MSRIKELRQAKKINQTQFAKELGVAQNTVSNWENSNRMIDIETLQRIATYFNVSTDYLLGRDIIQDKPQVTDDDDIKFALFGTTDIDDELYEDVKRIAKIQKQLKDEKEKARLLEE